MEFLFSNLPPMKTKYKDFSEAFDDLLAQSTRIDIAVGYVTADSLIDLKQMLQLNSRIKTLNLTIGMHYFDKFTRGEYDAALTLNDFLMQENRGKVQLVNLFRYHGKLYAFQRKDEILAGIIGSDNLSAISDSGIKTYESSVLLREKGDAEEIYKFISDLTKKCTKNIGELKITEFKQQNLLLDSHENVRKVSPNEYHQAVENETGISFEIPIKTSDKSNLNAYFGKGRESKKTGLIKPRHWYEVELIVPREITKCPGYPKRGTDGAVFDVITDDLWQFKCKVSGDYSKNFRSEGDLKILGKWLKGRMEQAGVLKPGEPVTQKTLQEYGRQSFTFTKTKEKNLWLLDFEAHK